MRKFFYYTTFLVLGLSICIACTYSEKFYEEADVKLRFSLDTLRFDTVFTSLGSATRYLKVYNDQDLPIRTSIKLAIETSKFRLNIDGQPSNSFTDIEIGANDSLYIFCEVTIDPDEPLTNSPFVVEEQLSFTTNGQAQFVLLEAWGQNANYFPDRFSNNKVYRQVCNMQEIVWDDPKPYVIYGVMILDSCTLRLPPGTKIYVHGGITNNEFGVYRDGLIYVFPRGKIISEGTKDDPVIFQGDRLEPEFQDEWGQWQGLRFAIGNKGSSLDHTIIKNAINGVILDSLASINVSSSKIYNCSNFGIYSYHADLNMDNSLIYNTGSHGVALTYGGNHNINYSTLANYNTSDAALLMTNFVCRGDLCQFVSINHFNLSANNNIIYGQGEDEISIGEIEGANMDYTFDHCIMRIKELLTEDEQPDFLEFCNECILVDPTDTLFAEPNIFNFHLDTLSIAEGMAKPLPLIKTDLDGNVRDEVSPDIGCYEYIER